MNSIDELKIISKIEEALYLTIDNEIDILRNGRVERNFTSCLAEQIATKLNQEDIRIDPFYNKHLGHCKKLDNKISLPV